MDLNIDYQAARDTGKAVSAEADNFKTELNKIKTSNSNLETYWQGQDASKYSKAVAEQAKVMDELQVTIDEIGTFLVNVGNAYEKAMEANKAGIN